MSSSGEREMEMTVLDRIVEKREISEQWVSVNGELVPKHEASVSIYDHGFLYGDGAFEGIRVYNGNIFRLVPHLQRLYRSVKALGFELDKNLDQFQSDVVSTVRANSHYDGYIRVTVSRGVGLGLDPKHLGTKPTTIISTEQLRLYPQEMYDNGLTVITASTRVPPPVCIDPQVKTTGKYINSISAKMEANRVGAGEALMLNMAGNVAEATGDNVFFVRNGEVVTPPTSEGALPGITRATVMEICKESGIPCREAVTTLFDIYMADEAFLTGTAAEVIPMVVLDEKTIGDGKPGAITNKIINRFRQLTLTDGVRID